MTDDSASPKAADRALHPPPGRVARYWLDRSVQGSAFVIALVPGRFVGPGAIKFEVLRAAVVILTSLAVMAVIRRKAPDGLSLPATVVTGVAAALGFILVNMLAMVSIAFAFGMTDAG